MRKISFSIAVLVLVAGCKKSNKPAPSSTELAPLASTPTTALAVPGHGAAVVDVPAGVRRAAPVLVAVLGIGDTPEEQCATWRELVGARAFVVCPRGAAHWIKEETDAGDAPLVAVNDESNETHEGDTPPAHPVAPAPKQETLRAVGFYPVDVASLEREIDAALGALKTRYSTYVDDREPIYVGFSRGAFLGASLVARHPDRFKRAILIEGGQSAWTAETAGAFARGGGERVLFACGQQSCVDESNPVAERLRAQKIDVKVVFGQEGHGYKKAVKEELRRSFDWVVESDARWN